MDEIGVTVHISHKYALLRTARVFSKVLRSLVASWSLRFIENIDDDDDDDDDDHDDDDDENDYINNNSNNSNKDNKTKLLCL